MKSVPRRATDTSHRFSAQTASHSSRRACCF